jgi:acyl dehydratase
VSGRLRELVGVELGPSSWLDVTQERIDAFAEATDDRQWIHVDAERAAAGPFGGTIAHGFLTLSLCVPLLAELLPPSEGMVVNYGVNRVRFPAAVPSGSRIRGRLRVTSVEEGTAGERANIEAVVECEGVDKPVCVAELVVLTVPLQPEAS